MMISTLPGGYNRITPGTESWEDMLRATRLANNYLYNGRPYNFIVTKADMQVVNGLKYEISEIVQKTQNSYGEPRNISVISRQGHYYLLKQQRYNYNGFNHIEEIMLS